MNRTAIFALLLILETACSFREDTRPRSPSWGFFTAKMNGKEWSQAYRKGSQVTQGLVGRSGTAIPCKGEFYHINSELYTSKGFSRQHLMLIKVPIIRGKYKVVPFVLGYCNEMDPVYGIFRTQLDDGDVLGDQYNILASEDNFIQVDSYDDKSKEIKGIFKLTFILERKSSEHILSDTLRFTGGKFHTKMMDFSK